MTALEITPIPLLSDNYAWLIRDVDQDVTVVVDPSEAAPVVAYLRQRHLRLDAVLNTHHHPDHTGGNLGLKEAFGCDIIGAEADRHRIAGLDRGLGEGDTYQVGRFTAKVIAIPGHTLGHIAFVFTEPAAVFCGDTLFSLGCGRLFEGSPEQMWTSLSRLAALPPATMVCCGHEYTAANAAFALTVDPDNQALQQRAKAVAELRSGPVPQPSVPSSIGLELATNPFLHPLAGAVLRHLKLPPSSSAAAAFAALRLLKDRF
jgi:hydroxyacylglutathione hydrolase